jgi:hypothetical protein
MQAIVQPESMAITAQLQPPVDCPAPPLARTPINMSSWRIRSWKRLLLVSPVASVVESRLGRKVIQPRAKKFVKVARVESDEGSVDRKGEEGGRRELKWGKVRRRVFQGRRMAAPRSRKGNVGRGSKA